jgi:molybdate transport repressor ModE-like protein
MRVQLELSGLIFVNGQELALLPTLSLLDGVAEERTVRGAAERLELSYRSAWGRVAALEQALGRRVVVKTKGHGTVLTSFGEAFRSTLRSATTRFGSALSKEQRVLQSRLAELMQVSPAKLKIAASHDPLLVQVLGARRDVVVSITGSGSALDLLAQGAVDVAGCHFGTTHAGRSSEEATLRDRGYVVRPMFVREQGLILPAGNPLKIQSVADLARVGARFINRQKGSGTRAWFDRMLSDAAISPADIVGYGAEEFTHQAVAAIVATGGADAALGVKAVADAFGLSFVPLGEETYYFVSRADQAYPALDDIADELESKLGEVPGCRNVHQARSATA